VDAYGEDRYAPLARGHLRFVNTLIDITTGMIGLMGQFDNAHETLGPGDPVTARLMLAVQPKVLTVPATAVVEGLPRGYDACVIQPDDTVVWRAVRVTVAVVISAFVSLTLTPNSADRHRQEKRGHGDDDGGDFRWPAVGAGAGRRVARRRC
jgi:hypothetical protein